MHLKISRWWEILKMLENLKKQILQKPIDIEINL